MERGLENLLSGAGIRLHRIDMNLPGALEVLSRSVKPGDTLLMEQRGQSPGDWEQILYLLRDLHAAALLVVNPGNSQVQVFLQQQRSISSPEELAIMIRQWGEWGRQVNAQTEA